MIRQIRATLLLLLMSCSCMPEGRPIHPLISQLGGVAAGFLALLKAPKCCRRKCRRVQKGCSRSVRSLCPCITCFDPGDEEEPFDQEVSMRLLAQRASRFAINKMHIILPALFVHSHTIFDQNLSLAMVAAYSVWLSNAISKRAVKWKRSEHPEHTADILVEYITLGGLSAFLMKVGTELFFVILPMSPFGILQLGSICAAGFVVGSVLVTKTLVGQVARFAGKGSKVIREGLSYLCCVVTESVQKCCSCCCKRRRGNPDFEVELNFDARARTLAAHIAGKFANFDSDHNDTVDETYAGSDDSCKEEKLSRRSRAITETSVELGEDKVPVEA